MPDAEAVLKSQLYVIDGLHLGVDAHMERQCFLKIRH